MKKTVSPEWNVTWKEYEPIYNRLAEIEARGTELRKVEGWQKDKAVMDEILALLAEESELEDKAHDMRPRLIPEIGVPCTVYYYSDCSAGRIIDVPTPKTIVVQQDGLYHGIKTFTYRRDGSWVEKGTTLRDPGTYCALGYRYDYYDRSF